MGILGKQIGRLGTRLDVRVFIGFAATIFLFCNVQNTAFAENAIKRVHDPIHQNEPNVCPSDSFQSFLDIFAESEEIQKSFTRFPIRMLTVVDADPEPKPVVKSLRASQVTYPLIPSAKERKIKKLVLHVERQGARQFKVNISKDNTGYLVSYYFIANKSCWPINWN